MRLELDANILFAALIKDSLTSELIITVELQLYAPEFLLDVFAKYEKVNKNWEDLMVLFHHKRV